MLTGMGRSVTQLYGYLTIPYRRGRVQNQKVPTPASEAVQAQAIAADVVERMIPGQAYILGPGTTTRAIAEHLDLPKTLMGVDIITREEILASDVGEQQILEMLVHRPLGLIVTPTGGQGFLFRARQPANQSASDSPCGSGKYPGHLLSQQDRCPARASIFGGYRRPGS